MNTMRKRFIAGIVILIIGFLSIADFVLAVETEEDASITIENTIINKEELDEGIEEAEPPITEPSLEELLTEANELIHNIKPSLDGKDIMKFDSWVTEEIYLELVQAIDEEEGEKLSISLEKFKINMQDGFLEGARLIRDGQTITVLEGSSEESDPLNRAEISLYYYAKGEYTTYDQMQEANITESDYSETTKSFTVDETGIYTIRIVYKNGASNHLFIDLDLSDTLTQIIEKAKERYTETALIEVEDSESGIDISDNEQWVRVSDREALRLAILIAEEKIESARNENGLPINESDSQELTEALNLFETKVNIGPSDFASLTLEKMKIVINPPKNSGIEKYQYAIGSYNTYEELLTASNLKEVSWEVGKEFIRANEQETYTIRIEYKPDEITGITKEPELHRITIKKEEITQYICYFSEELNNREEEFKNRLLTLLSN